MTVLSHSPKTPPFNLAAYVLANGGQSPDKIALEVLGKRAQNWTYANLTAAVLGVAQGLLNAGLNAGDVVLLRLGNTADFPIAYLGAIAAGMIAVPTSSALTVNEITKMARGISPKAVLQDATLSAPDLMDAKQIPLTTLQSFYDLPPADWHFGNRERAAYIVFTSGTSGTPRAVLHAHRAILARRKMFDGWYDLRADDRLLHAGAFNWTFTLGTGLMDPWTMGATALIPEDGTEIEELPKLLAAHKATLFAAAPGVFRKLLRCEFPKLPQFRHALSAGEKMPNALHERWAEQTGTKVYEAFGMSECSTFISSSPQSPSPTNALGRVQNGRRVALLDTDGTPVKQGDIGTISVHRDDTGLMLGYQGAPGETKARFSGDWFLTGDLAFEDADGAIHYQGRADDMMNAGGFRVSPLEVERVFQGLKGLDQCAAIEVTLKADTQIIALCYSAQAPLEQSTLEALATRELARYKHPRIYHHSDTLPISANGKLLRRELRSQIEAQYGQS